jgi:hypothetical protein
VDAKLLDDETRSTPIGFFNFAESYWRAAQVLEKAKLKTTHPHSPISFLYYHAIELYLKSYLRMHGISARVLASRQYGHKTDRLTQRAADLGLFLMDEDREVVSLMAETDAVIRSRYLQTGLFRWPTHGALNRTCRSFRSSIGKEMKAKGIKVRL